MRTLLMVAAGMVVAPAFDGIAALMRKRSGGAGGQGATLFVCIWLTVTAVDFWAGVDSGHAVSLELGAHLIVFALPVALAWYLSRRRLLRAASN